MKSEASSHVALTHEHDSVSLDIIPSYAMGNDFDVEKLTEGELETRVMSQRLLYAVLHLMQTKLKESNGKGKRKLSPSDDEDVEGVIEKSVNCVVKCIKCPVFVATSSMSTPSVSDAPLSGTFSISTASDALACLQVFQAVHGITLPVMSPTFMDLVSVVFNIPGPERRPPSAHDLNIYRTLPSAFTTSSDLTITPDAISMLECSTKISSLEPLIKLDSNRSELIMQFVQQPSFYRPPSPQRHDIPDVPGAFLMTDVLSPLECCQLITMAETMNYTPDAVFGIDNVIWLGNEVLMSLLADRVEPLIPAILNSRKFAGINARLRLFRYYAGAVYRPHIDGAWPGSGLSPDGTFTDDAFMGDRHSQLTFLVYLNDGFDGGATTFFLAGKDGADEGSGEPPAVIEARGVQPKQGSVLCFPHGHAVGSLVHEGSAVANGVKYVIRSDALYYI